MKNNLIAKVFVSTSIFFITIFTFSKLSLTDESTRNKNTNSFTRTTGGNISGVVRFPVDYPEREKITITKDQQICGAFQYSEIFVVSEESRGLKNVVVSLEIKPDKKNAKEVTQATLDQKGCQYIPHVQAVPVGVELEILNSDGILHNVHAYHNALEPQNTVFNKAQPKFLKKIKQNLNKAGIYFFKCDVHEHMSAYVAVFDHPFYSVTDENGKFNIGNVPPGSYKIHAWHEALGKLEKTVTVEAGTTAEVNFDILPNE